MAKVYLKFNSAVIKEMKLEKDETTFGRKTGNDIVIDHPTISGFHGKIKKDGDNFVVEDLGSTNGTFLRGQKIKSGSLKEGDQIGVAGHILEFHLDDSNIIVTPSAPPLVSDKVQEEASAIDAQNKVLKNVASAAPEKEKESEGIIKKLPPGSGVVKIISGGVNGQTEVFLKELVTYIGTTDQAAIKIKGFLVPSLAAAISHRPEGYFLKAVKPGYPKVNGNSVNEQVYLENGALIEVGGTNMVFYQNEKKETA
jgi:predicted component of type VI protein secretion system